MSDLSQKLSINDTELVDDLKTLIGISLGVFLLILFLQPFNLDHIDFNNKLLLIMGFAGIVFFFLCVFFIILPRVLPVIFASSEWESRPDFLIVSLICVLSTVAFAFYLRYVGSVILSMYIVFKIVLICLFPPIVLRQICTNKSLKNQIRLLIIRNNELYSATPKYHEDKPLEIIEIYSENSAEKIEFLLGTILAIKSADNYIEIYYLEHNKQKKQLVRSTLRNVDEQLKKQSDFLRVHRTCIINMKYAEKLIRNLNGYALVLKNFDQEIPVSRQYILKVKEALNQE